MLIIRGRHLKCGPVRFLRSECEVILQWQVKIDDQNKQEQSTGGR